MDRHTTIDDPFFVVPGGILISSTDILPTELCELKCHYIVGAHS